eukprot:TRINITY_DN15350_c0_g1_i1.p1 TRINITY_DN15350_c0_g1~~TRINITY_DN15350_c0_g1_i1.p1  ORF type:complete len:478 (+),score=146.65 TRINITY_DN15350_c0_g1_i1:73-1506(+)
MEYRRNSSFRPRPIDVDKPMPVLQNDLEDDLIRNVSEVKSGMEELEEQEIHFQEALKLFNKKQNNAAAIPIPYVAIVKGYDEEKTEPFHPDSSYIKYQEPLHQVEYDMESDDFEYFEQLQNNGFNLTEDDYEWIIDRFEITSGSNIECIDFNKALEAVREAGKEYEEQLISKMHHFWVQKRKRKGKPLYIKFHLIPKMDDPNPYCAFRPRENKKVRKSKKNSQTVVLKLLKIKKDLENVKEILALTIDREKIKKQKISAMKKMHFDIIEKAKDQPFAEKIDLSNINKNNEDSMRDSSEENEEDEQDMECVDSHFDVSSSFEDEENVDAFEDNSVTYFDKFRPRVLRHFNKDAPLTQTIYEFTSGSLKDESGKDIPSFVGRARYGRNGRLYIDRIVDEKTSSNKNIVEDCEGTDELNFNKIKKVIPSSSSRKRTGSKSKSLVVLEDQNDDDLSISSELEDIFDEMDRSLHPSYRSRHN